MSTIATEACVVSMWCCVLILHVVLLVCRLNLYDPKKALKMKFQNLATLLLSGVASSANVIKSVVSSTTTRRGELKINLCLSYRRLLIINPCSLQLIDLESKKHEDLKMSFIFLHSLSESRDEIPVKWGSLSYPKISNFGLCVENTK